MMVQDIDQERITSGNKKKTKKKSNKQKAPALKKQ